jgi:hypothetical protein
MGRCRQSGPARLTYCHAPPCQPIGAGVASRFAWHVRGRVPRRRGRARRHVKDVESCGPALGHDRHHDLLITLFLGAPVYGEPSRAGQPRDRGSRLRRVAYRPAPPRRAKWKLAPWAEF